VPLRSLPLEARTPHRSSIWASRSRRPPQDCNAGAAENSLHGRWTIGRTTENCRVEFVCPQLLAQDRDKFHSLVTHFNFGSTRRHHSFCHTSHRIRTSFQVGPNLLTEIYFFGNFYRKPHPQRLSSRRPRREDWAVSVAGCRFNHHSILGDESLQIS
jgi:hypothetical protein